jgi:hypothetical protein
VAICALVFSEVKIIYKNGERKSARTTVVRAVTKNE